MMNQDKMKSSVVNINKKNDYDLLKSNIMRKAKNRIDEDDHLYLNVEK